MKAEVRRSFALMAASALLISACATREPRPAGAWLEQRADWFERHPEWSLSGRVGLSDGQRGGSLSFHWRASVDHHRIDLRTTTGGKRWQLEFGPHVAILEGSDIDRLVGTEPDPLVEAAVGWPIPVAALAWWIRGLPGGHEERAVFAPDGTLEQILGDDWRLVYQRFEEVNGQLMPARMQATSGEYRVRLALREWRWAAMKNEKSLY